MGSDKIVSMPSSKPSNIYSFLSALRDLLLIAPFISPPFAKILADKVDFVFLVHPMDLKDFAKQFPFMRFIPQRYLKMVSRHLWPIIGPAIDGYITPNGAVKGRVIFCPLTTKMMLLKKDAARAKILTAVKLGEKLGAKMIGLGAFIPIVTEDGLFLKDKTKVTVTTGTAYAAVISMQNVLQIAEILGINNGKTCLAIVGAGGSVGSLCAIALADKFDKVILVDKNYDAAIAVRDSIKKINNRFGQLIVTAQVDTVIDADIVLAVTNVPGAVIKSRHLKSGAVVVDAGFPKNVSKKVIRERNDVLVIESGIAQIPGVKTVFDFQMGIKSIDEVFSCLAEALLLLWLGQTGKYVGKIDYSYFQQLFNGAESGKIKLAKFRNDDGYITNDKINDFRKMLNKINSEMPKQKYV